MARTVFFSFHYQRDIFRVNQVKNHYLTKGNYTEAGYFNGSLEEKAKSEGDNVVRRLIDNGLNGSSVLCVLIGSETFNRRWVHYEIFKSVELGMGVFGVRIHKLPDPRFGRDTPGPSPFEYLGYGSKNDTKMYPMIKYDDGWKNAPLLSPITPSVVGYLKGKNKPILKDIFQIYDWQSDFGYYNFGNWIENAARQAGR